VPSAELRADHGLIGDAHAGAGHRQVSLLAQESIDELRRSLPSLAAGDFGENVVTEAIELRGLRIGDRLRLGERVVLEVSQIGKECHEGCAIQRRTGRCIMPTEGVFCRVVQGGVLAVGDEVLAIAPAPGALEV
jgi:cyclic pyranopterin phosphate synthase